MILLASATLALAGCAPESQGIVAAANAESAVDAAGGIAVPSQHVNLLLRPRRTALSRAFRGSPGPC